VRGQNEIFVPPNTPSYSNTHECEVGYTKHVHEGVLEMEKAGGVQEERGSFSWELKTVFPFYFPVSIFSFLFFSFLLLLFLI